MAESRANIVEIKASCSNCKNKQTRGEDERYYCTKQLKYLESVFWSPVCVDFCPEKEVMQEAIDKMQKFYSDNSI